MSKNVLITGITGMVGSHLADYLLNKTNWKPAKTFEKYEATPTLSQRFSRKQMRLPNYTKPLIKRIMQHYTGIDKKKNSVSTAWNRKIDQLQKDEQEARRALDRLVLAKEGYSSRLKQLLTEPDPVTEDEKPAN